MITLTIDGKTITTRPGRTILEAAREGGISIPTLCYHESLLPIGSCRLCVVEVAGYRDPMTACTTPAQDGIVVTTQSEKLFAMRTEFLKLILAAHPLDCPQCDKGGECRLQDLVAAHGIETAEYQASRQDRKEPYATPLIRYWELRCVLCGRCYHACREISGRAAIDIAGKGFDARIAATNPGDCISCGECLSLCPVGALTEDLSPLKSRPWQSERIDTTCPHCGFGCRLTLNVCDGRFISKVLSDSDLPPNGPSLCVRGRFGYDFVENLSRLTAPWRAADGQKRQLGWEEALATAAENLKRLSAEGKGIGLIVSPRVTNEEMLLLSRIAGLFPKTMVASSAFYHTGTVAAALKNQGIEYTAGYEALAGCDLIVVAGADLLVNNHLLANKVRQAVTTTGARLVVVDPLPSALSRMADAHLQVIPGQDARLFNALSRRLVDGGGFDDGAPRREGFAEWKSALCSDAASASPAPAGVDEMLFAKAGKLIGAAHSVAVIVGSGISDCREGLTALLNFSLLKGLPGRGALIPTALQANARGADAILGPLSSPEEVLGSPDMAGVLLYEEDPFHFLNGQMVKNALAAKEFVAVCDLFPTEAMELAHLAIPAAAFAEKEGTVLSGDGRLRAVCKAIVARPGGPEFLRELLARLGGGSSDRPEELGAGINEMFAAGAGGVRPGAGGAGRFAAVSSPAAPATGARPYRLILRDLFGSHHLVGSENTASGIARVRKGGLFISPTDAAALGLGEGDEVRLESGTGAAIRPVAIKAGVKAGTLECLLVGKRGDILALSPRLAKVIEVSLRKA